MERSSSIDEVDALLAAIRRPRGATEPRLTSCMAKLLGADLGATVEVARMLVQAAPNTAVGSDVKRVPSDLEVSAEQPFTFTSRVRRRSTDRRMDLVWRSIDSRWALVTEAKLGANFSRNQLEHMLAVPSDRLGLNRDAVVGVIALTARPHNLGRLKDPQQRWLGEIRWSEILDALHRVSFQDAAVAERWHLLLSIYMGRSRFGSQAAARPSARAALEFVARGTREHLEQHVGGGVKLDVEHAGHAVHGGSRKASIAYRFRAHRRQRILTVELRRPRGHRREISLRLEPGGAHLTRPCPAELVAFQIALYDAIDALFRDSGLR